MSIDLGSAFGKIIIDADDALKSTERLGGVLGGFGKSLQTVGAVATAGLGIATGAVAGVGAAVLGLAQDAAAIPGVTSAFETLTSTMDGGATAMLAALQDSSGGLITNTELMRSFNTAASLVGKDFAERLPDSMGYLSKVSAATGQDMGFMLDSLVKGVGRLSPLILDNLGIQVNLAEANEEYAASIGKTADELTKSEQQTALMNQVMEKLAENTEGMEGLSNPFEAFRVTLQNVKDDIGAQLLPAVTPLIEKFSELAQQAIPILMEKVDAFIALFSTIGGVILEFIGNLQDGMTPLDAFIEAMRGILPPEMLAGLIDFRDNVLPGLMEQVTAIKDGVIELITPVAEAVMQFFSWKDVMLAAAVGIAAIVLPIIWSLITAMAPILLTVAAVIAVVALLRNAWENNWGGIQEKTAAVIAFVQNLIQTAFAAIQAFWTAHGEQIMATAAAAWAAIQAGITAVITVIKTLVTNALTAIQGFWDKHGAAITEVAKKAWTLISDLIDGVFKTIQKLFEAFKLLFEGDWEGFLDKAGEMWETAWDTMVEYLSGLWDLVKPILLDFWEEVKVWFREKATEFQGIGTALIGGLVAGIDSAKETIRAALQGIADNIPDWLKQMLGIASPARATIPIGYAIAQGIVAGIQAGAADVQSAMEGIFSAMGNVAGVAGSFGSQFVRQILDPAREDFEAAGDEIAAIDEEMAALAARWGGEELLNSPGMLTTLGELLKSQHLNDAERANIQRLIALYGERNKKQTEYVDLQQKVMAAEAQLADLEERRAQNQFLQDQLKLLELIKDNNLGADILNGIKLGIDADAEQLMVVMSMALQRMIEAAQAQLGIASPSKVFRAMGRNLMESVGLGITDGRGVVDAMRDAMGAMTAAGRAGLPPTQIDNGQTANLYGGQHFYIQQARRNVLDDIQVLLAR